MKITPVKLAIIMIVSILATAKFGFTAIMVVSAALLIPSGVYFVIKRKIDLGVLLAVFVTAFSCASYTFSVCSYSHPTINCIDNYATLQGITTSSARESTYSDTYKYNFKISSIETHGRIIKSNETILLSTPEKINCGEGITVSGLIADLPQSMNESDFDTAKYYKSQNIFTRIYSEDITHDFDPKPFSFYTVGGRIAEKIDSVIYSHYADDGAAILSAVLVGNRHHFSNEYNSVLQDTGFKHLFHGAYLHIAIIVFIIALFRKFAPKRICDTATVLIFISYAFLQSSNIGFARCLLCSAGSVLAQNLRGRTYFPDIAAYIVMLCGILSPTIIFNAAFVLSLCGGMLIWAFVPPLSKKLKTLPRILRRPVAFTIVSLFLYTPFSMYYFDGICIYTTLAIFITAPAVVTLLITAPITLLLLTLFGAAPPFATYTNIMVTVLYKLPFIIKDLPLSQINLPTPSPMFIITYIFALVALFYRIKKHHRPKRVCSAILCGLCLSLVVNVSASIGTAEFTFVNVDQGDGAVIRTPFRETVIIDGGGGVSNSTTYNSGSSIFVPYLQSQGINRIEVAVVTHYHHDHIDGVISAIEKIKTDIVFAPAPTKYYSDDMRALMEKLKETAAAHGTRVYFVDEDTEVTFRDGLSLRFYTPSLYLGISSENNTSMAVKVCYGDFTALYTGDTETDLEHELLSRADINSDILKVGHHGSRNASSEEFIDAVSPTYSVISCGEGNLYGHPHAETLERLSDSRVLRTDTLGDIRFRVRKDGEVSVSSQNDKSIQ